MCVCVSVFIFYPWPQEIEKGHPPPVIEWVCWTIVLCGCVFRNVETFSNYAKLKRAGQMLSHCYTIVFTAFRKHRIKQVTEK